MRSGNSGFGLDVCVAGLHTALGNWAATTEAADNVIRLRNTEISLCLVMMEAGEVVVAGNVQDHK